MIRQDQKQEEDDESSHEARETVHQQGEGSFRALISSTTQSSPILELRHSASGKIVDSDDDCLSPGEDEDEEGDKNFSNNHVSSHLSLDASPEGIDRLANFPLKLHKMLERAEIEGFQTTVSWLHQPISGQPTTVAGKTHGASMDNIDGEMSSTPFKVHNPEKFVHDVIPRFFQMTKFKSFLRQLNIWGFSRDRSKGTLNGSYYHKDFVRQDPELCQKMRRTKNKGMYKRGTKGSSPLNKATKRSTAKVESIETTLSVGKDLNSEDSKLGRGTSLSSTSHSVHEVGARLYTRRPDLPSLNHRDMRSDSALFPIAYRAIMRGIEKGREQVFSGDLEVQISSQHQQIFLGGGVEAPLLSQSSLNQPISWYTSGTRQDACTDRQNSLVFPPPLPTPSREMVPRMLAQGGTSFAGAANDPSSSRIANWPQGPQGERQGVFSQNMTGQSNAAAGTAPGSVVREGWRSAPPFVMTVSSTSSLQQDTSMSLGATMPRSSNIAQLLTNPQMPTEDLKYILVGFQLGAANKEEDDQSHAHAHASSLEGVEQLPSEPGGEQGPSQKFKSSAR